MASSSPSSVQCLLFAPSPGIKNAHRATPQFCTLRPRFPRNRALGVAGAHAPSFVRASISDVPSEPLVTSTDRAAGLPWTESIAGGDVELLFMPFLQHQLEIMGAEFPDIEDSPFEKDLSFQSSDRRPARIESWQWTSPHFRKIRATYIDAGIAAQVFNSVWYPDPKYDLPLLGIDFLSFGKKKVLCVLDFQPLLQDDNYLRKYCEPIAYIKEKYEGLAGTMSARFYDETQFFSKQLAFAQFDNAEPVETQLFPAFKEYLRDYVSMVKRAEPNEEPSSKAKVRQLHADYDQYSAERDPAVGLFSTYWGEAWAERFTHDFLFSDSVPLSQEEKDRRAADAKNSKSKSANPSPSVI
jgi:15,16-dihydrobiliverdin:ferredoxin oxidoreductase